MGLSNTDNRSPTRIAWTRSNGTGRHVGAHRVRHERGIRRRFENALHAAGVVGIVVHEPHPAQVSKTDAIVDGGQKVVAVDADPGVHEHGLSRFEQERVDRENSVRSERDRRR